MELTPAPLGLVKTIWLVALGGRPAPSELAASLGVGVVGHPSPHVVFSSGAAGGPS